MKYRFHSIALGVLLVISCYACSKSKDLAPTISPHLFAVYGFVPYTRYLQNGVIMSTTYAGMSDYLATIGVKRINLIYENRILDYPDGNKTHGIPDTANIEKYANLALQDPGTPVSLDLEGWSRFDTVHTPDKLIQTINLFKKANPVSKIGLYAEVPFDTFGWDSTISRYDKFNKAFLHVAMAVDYFSPSLYNYGVQDTATWKKGAIYNFQQIQQYQMPQKDIIPYLTPAVSSGSITTELSYEEMTFKLQTVYDLGARGCIIWTSSQTRDSAGNPFVVDINSGWAKAIKDFIAIHH